MARLYASENLPFPVVEELRRLVRLHADVPGHQGIVVCSFDPDFARLARRIDAQLAIRGSLQGLLIRVDRAG